jgi:hypothetical protein
MSFTMGKKQKRKRKKYIYMHIEKDTQWKNLRKLDPKNLKNLMKNR